MIVLADLAHFLVEDFKYVAIDLGVLFAVFFTVAGVGRLADAHLQRQLRRFEEAEELRKAICEEAALEDEERRRDERRAIGRVA